VEVRLHELTKVEGGEITLDSLKAVGVIPHFAKQVKIIASGELQSAVKLTGIKVTAGARAAIEAAGGTIAE